MSYRYLSILVLLVCLSVQSVAPAKGDSKVEVKTTTTASRNEKQSNIDSIRAQEFFKMNILVKLYHRIKNHSNQSFYNLTENEKKAIGRRTSACLASLDKKSDKRNLRNRNKSQESNRCIIAPPLCPNLLSADMKDQSLADISFLFEANNFYEKRRDMESLKVISMNLNLKLHKKGVKTSKRSNIYLKIYGITNKQSDSSSTHLLKSVKVIPGKRRWIKVQLGKEFSKFQRDTRSKREPSGPKPWGITLLLENDKGRYFQPEYLFIKHRCTNFQNVNSSFSMPHLMVSQMTKLKKGPILTNIKYVTASNSRV